jgi:putative flippase GtrA
VTAAEPQGTAEERRLPQTLADSLTWAAPGGNSEAVSRVDRSAVAASPFALADLLRPAWGLRIVRFGSVVASCTLLQLLVLACMARLGANKVMANGIGFALSAQANYVLSARLTWWESRTPGGRHARQGFVAGLASPGRRAKFYAIAATALAVNELVFILATHSDVQFIAASCAGIASGAAVAFTLNNLAFREAASVHESGLKEERRPAFDEVRRRLQREGVAFFLPAFNEAVNLRIIVPRIITYFRHLACPFTLIIVDDGSTRDDTFGAAERLADAYPEHVEIVHHAQNKGYGAALASGIRRGLQTQHGLIAFCDADDQFDIESFGTLIVALKDQQADLAVGYRIARADSLKRRLMGSAWHRLSALVLGFTEARDVDCGFKVFTRAVAEDVGPRISADYAAVSPEILARAKAAGFRVVEAGITHKDRVHGQQTGSNLKVVILSLIHLLQLRRLLRREGGSRGWKPASTAPATGRDYTAWGVAIVSAVLSVLAYVITARLHGVLLYLDAYAHMEKARMVLSGTSPGLGQLGDVWLPLPHLLMLPFVWNTTLYQDGFAGAIVSMIAYVVTAVLVYKISFRLTRRKIAGIAASAVFALNVNMLYMQSTPMTEALLFCMMAAMVYCIQQWAETDQYKFLLGGAATAFLATLTRYESWPVLACLIIAVPVISWERKHSGLTPKLRWAGLCDRTIVFSVIACAGIAGWVIWSWILFGSPLDFLNGTYAKPSLWVPKGDPTIGNWIISAKTYGYAILDNEPWPLLLLAAAGLVCLIAQEWRSRRAAARSLPVLSLLVIVPFFIVSLYTGQRPLTVMQVDHGIYNNVRFGLIMLVPTAIFTGYLVGTLGRFKPLMCGLATLVLILTAGSGSQLIREHNVVTYSEARSSLYVLPDQVRVDAFLKRGYRGGRVLMESFGNEKIVFQVPSNQLVYEGSYRQWLPALKNPAGNHIEMIIARCGGYPYPDEVCRALNKRILRDYVNVYTTPDHDYRVYQLRKRELHALSGQAGDGSPSAESRSDGAGRTVAAGRHRGNRGLRSCLPHQERRSPDGCILRGIRGSQATPLAGGSGF